MRPGEDAAFLSGLVSELRRGGDDVGEAAKLLRDGGEDIVVVWGERIGADAVPHLLALADVLGLPGRVGAGLLEVPAGANGRGLREAGAAPDCGPGYTDLGTAAGRSAAEIARAAAEGSITALHLFGTDPVRDHPDRALWERAMHAAGLVVAHASVLTDGIREHANVVFPAESYAEKEGTVVHPDGRLQRLRMAIAHPGQVRAGWSVLVDIAKRCGLDTGVLTSGMAFTQLGAAVPFYDGLTLDEIAGRGVRWPARDAAAKLPEATLSPSATPTTNGTPPRNGALRLGTYRPIWAAPEVEISPALHFVIVHQQLELSPEDASRLDIANGDDVTVAQNGTRLHARAAVRTGVPEGTAFLADGIETDSANALTEPTIEISKA